MGILRSSKFLLRVGLSVTLLAVIYASVDFSRLLVTLKQMTIGTLVIISLLYVVGQIMSAAKWQIFLRGSSFTYSFGEVTAAYFLGMFVNTFGLGTVGGDIARAVALRPERKNYPAAIATVIADRLHGLVVLAAIGAIATLLVQPGYEGPYGALLAELFLVGLCFGFFLGPKLLTRILPPEHKFAKLNSFLKRILGGNWPALIQATIISLAFHTLQIGMHWIIAQQLDVPLSFGFLFAAAPLVNIASTLPISVNGLGVREALWTYMFLHAGIPTETAVAFGAFWFVCVTIVSALAGLVGTSRFKIEAIEQAVKDAEDLEPVKTDHSKTLNKSTING